MVNKDYIGIMLQLNDRFPVLTYRCRTGLLMLFIGR